MKKYDLREWAAAAGMRAIKTVCETLASTLPAGFVITPVMVENANWTIIYAIVAWFGTGLLSGIIALLASVKGLPELETEDEAIYDDREE